MTATSLMAQNDFRKGSWGDSQAEITKREGQINILTESDTYGFEANGSDSIPVSWHWHLIILSFFMLTFNDINRING